MIFYIKPLSVNKVWLGRHIKTNDYRAYEIQLSSMIKKQKLEKHQGNVHIMISFYFKSKLSDIDNCLKPILDILVKNGIIKDDRYVMALTVTKSNIDKTKKEGFQINITDWE